MNDHAIDSSPALPPDPAAPLAPRLTRIQLSSLFAIAVFAELISVGWISAFLGVEQGLATYRQAAVLALLDLTLLCVVPGPLFLLYDRYPLAGGGARRHLMIRVAGGVALGITAGLVTDALNHAISPIIGLSPQQIARAFPDRLGPVLWSLFCVGSASLAYLVLRRMHAGMEYERYAASLRELAAEARLTALTAELRPHFLFNALNGLAEVVHQDPVRAEQLLLHLSTLLQESLRSGDSPFVSLRQELSLMDSYLALQEMRFSDRLIVERHIPENLQDVLVPPLILQPLVENAVVHGIEGVADSRSIRITAEQVTPQQMVVRIEDDGPGLGRGTHRGGGLGLRNVRQRLRACFGEAGWLELEDKPWRGARASVFFPLHRSSI